jgi:hypothetical protein
MHRTLIAVLLLAATPATSHAQALFIAQGERAAEGSAGWSSGAFSNGLETHGAVSFDGRWDAGIGLNRYVADFGGNDDTTLTEWHLFGRYFLFKEQDDATPVTLAAYGAFFLDNYEGDDEGWYALAGAQLFKKFTMSEGFSLYPYIGFALGGESYSFGAADPERALYLTRQFGVHGQLTLGDRSWLRVTAEEHSFRRETFRAVRVAYVRRF